LLSLQSASAVTLPPFLFLILNIIIKIKALPFYIYFKGKNKDKQGVGPPKEYTPN
jgi:hypothetical protein